MTSTQDLMRERLLGGDEVHGLVIRAGVQDAGRGRRGLRWSSGPGGSYQTIAVRDASGAKLARPQVTLLIAAGIAGALRELKVPALVKWPNDLYLNGRKLGGILCEYLRRHLLVGVGINVANDIPEDSTRIDGLDAATVGDLVIRGMASGLELIEQEAPLPDLFRSVDALAGRVVTTATANGVKQGVAQGVDAQGRLLVATTAGVVPLTAGQELGPVRMR